jgi:hypothetical protein
VVITSKLQSGVAVVVMVGVSEAVVVGVSVSDGVEVGVIVKVSLGVKVLDGVGEPMKIAGGRFNARDTRNFSTTPRWAETRWIIGQI